MSFDWDKFQNRNDQYNWINLKQKCYVELDNFRIEMSC